MQTAENIPSLVKTLQDTISALQGNAEARQTRTRVVNKKAKNIQLGDVVLDPRFGEIHVSGWSQQGGHVILSEGTKIVSMHAESYVKLRRIFDA